MARDCGKRMCRMIMTSHKITDARATRANTSVKGGKSCNAISVKKNDPPHNSDNTSKRTQLIPSIFGAAKGLCCSDACGGEFAGERAVPVCVDAAIGVLVMRVPPVGNGLIGAEHMPDGVSWLATFGHGHFLRMVGRVRCCVCGV